MKKIYTAILVLFVSITNMNCTDDIAKSTLTQPGDKVPNFQIETINGEILDTNKLQGKIILLNLFTTTCPICQEEFPYLQKLSEQIQDKDFLLLSIGREHNKKELEEFVSKKGLTFTFAADPERKIYKNFATQYIPRTYLIDRKGIIIKQSVGFDLKDFEEFTNKINDLLDD